MNHKLKTKALERTITCGERGTMYAAALKLTVVLVRLRVLG